MISRTRFALAAALLALVAQAAHADVYGWQDAQGKWHYSDVPVEGAKLIRKGARSGASASGGGAPGGATQGAASSGAAATIAAGVAASDQLGTEAAARAVQADLDGKRAEQCKQASERYDKMIAARRLYTESKPGERVYLSEAELAQARVEARRERDAACGGAPR